ncbi:MAG: aldo/keto reductase [Clostridium sp.]
MRKFIIKGFKDGKEIDIEASALLMGSGDFLRIDNMEFAAPILDKFIEIGGNIFDTARHYRHSEKALCHWMKERGNRDDLIIFTKGCHPVREFPDTPRVKPECIREDVETSLEMLGTDHVEMFALHRDDVTQPVGPIMEELDKLVKEGKVYAIGVSNWELDRIIEANDYAKEHGLTPFTFNSPNLSLAKCKIPRWPGCVSANEAMIKWHEENNMAMVSWSSQAGGFFSGAFAKDKLDNQEMVDVYYCDENWERYDRAIDLAEKLGVTPIQVALAYVVNQKFPTGAAIGPEKMEELLSSVEGSKITLTEEQVNWLDLR